MKALVAILALFGVLLIFYLSWLPEPNIGSKAYFPKWLGEWVNANGNLRTAVPFVFLAFVMQCFLFSRVKDSARPAVVLAVSLTIVLLAEAGQLVLPKRHFDWGDVGWAAIGSISGILLAIVTNRLKIIPKRA